MKRKRKGNADGRVVKRQRCEDPPSEKATWPLLRHYYPEVLTLRNYLASSLSKSKSRRKRVLHYGMQTDRKLSNNADASVINLLDKIVIGSPSRAGLDNTDTLDSDISIFTQQLSESTNTISPTQGALKQTEVGYRSIAHLSLFISLFSIHMWSIS